jgi:hypothetical protein
MNEPLADVKTITKNALKVSPLAVGIGAASVLLFLATHFLLNSWAEASGLNHSIEHVLILVSGIGIGGSASRLLSRQK